MELITVEPLDGSELERLITALLNATGATHQLIESTDRDPAARGPQVIGACAGRMRSALAELSEHYDDDELAFITGILAWITLLIADELGIGDAFREQGRGHAA